MTFPSISVLREEAQKLGIDPQPFGRSKKKLSEAIEKAKFSALAEDALKSSGTGNLDWGSAIKGKAKTKVKTKVKTKAKTIPKAKTIRTAKTVKATPPTVRKVRVIEGVPKGMKRVKYPHKYDPNNPQPRKNGAGPRMMVCGHQEWWWDKKEGKCLACFPRNAFGR